MPDLAGLNTWIQKNPLMVILLCVGLVMVWNARKKDTRGNVSILWALMPALVVIGLSQAPTMIGKVTTAAFDMVHLGGSTSAPATPSPTPTSTP
jgi:hypothetical protein